MAEEELHQDFIFRSKLPDIYIPNHLPLHAYCFHNISRFRHRPCLINGPHGMVYSYDDVELTARRVAAGLHSLGIRQGQVIMILLQNSPEFVFSFFGVSFIGATSTTANPFCTPAEIAKQATSCDAKLIITQSAYVEKVRDLPGGVKIVTVDSPPEGCLHFSALTQSDELEIPEVKIDPDDVVALPYSSGTTGLPKGVMLTHKGQVTNVAQQVDGENPNLHFQEEDVILCVCPLFHIFSLNSVLFCALRVGAAVLMMPKFDVKELMELVERHRVTVAALVPPILLAVAKSTEVEKYDLSCIRMILCGAAPMRKELEDAVRAKLPNAKLGQGYGMTEAGPVISMSLAFAKEPMEIKAGASGTVVRNAEMKIVDPNTGASLSRNQSGEICVRGAQIMKGYLKEQESTEGTIDKQGWLHTGDIGYVDDDDEVFIVDRLKELIKYKGFQVAPAELEALLLAHPSISDAAVVPMTDEAAGEVPVAFVVKTDGSDITQEEIMVHISKQVVFYKRVKRVFFTDMIPRAASGKILRKQLKAVLIDSASAQPSPGKD